MMSNDKREIGIIKVWHYNKAGELLYKNNAALYDAGTEKILKSYFTDTDAPVSGFLMDLSEDDSPAVTDTTFTPVAGSGYDSQTVNRNVTDMTVDYYVGAGGPYWRVTTKVVSFIATGDWSIAKNVVLSGKVGVTTSYQIGFGSLSTPRTLSSGDRLDVSIVIKPRI